MTYRGHPKAFIVTFLVGICFHTWALAFTSMVLSNGTGSELNPLYYPFGEFFFWVLSYSFVVFSYLAIWFLQVSSKARWAILLALTGMTAYDFAHDFFVLEFHQSVTFELWTILLKILRLF
jgi:hypothetical protein